MVLIGYFGDSGKLLYFMSMSTYRFASIVPKKKNLAAIVAEKNNLAFILLQKNCPARQNLQSPPQDIKWGAPKEYIL